MRQRRREARARPTLPARPAAGGASCAVPREGAADVTPSPGLGGGGLLGSPWGPQVRLQIGRLRYSETRARRRLHKGRGPGPSRGAPGWGCGGAARTQRRRAGGSALTGPAGAVHARSPAGEEGEAALPARSLSRSGRGAAPWNCLLQGPAPACCSGSAQRLSAHSRTRRARRAGRLLPAPGRRGGAGPGTPTWPRARAATCGPAFRRRHKPRYWRHSRAGLQHPSDSHSRRHSSPPRLFGLPREAAGRGGPPVSPRRGTGSPPHLAQQVCRTSEPCVRAEWADWKTKTQGLWSLHPQEDLKKKSEPHPHRNRD